MNSDPWGGSEVQWFAAAKYALEKGDDVTCLVYEWEEKKNKMNDLALKGATINYIPNYGRIKKNLYQRLYFEWVTRMLQKRYVYKFDFSKFDCVVVNQGGFMEVANSPWKNLYKKLNKYCLTFHNYDLSYTFNNSKSFCLKLWMQNANCLICDAAKILSVLEKQLDSNFNNIVPLVNPLTIEKSTSYTTFPKLVDGKYKIIMLAQLDINRKAQDNLIKSFSNKNWENRNFIVELYGDGEHFSLLENLIGDLDLKNKIFLKGKTNNVSKALEEAHLVLQITRQDALPISVIEAMSKSRAVVVSDVGDMPLWIKDNVNGWVAKDASVVEILKVLEKAWESKELWENMGKKAFDYFEANFPKSVEEIFYNNLKTKN